METAWFGLDSVSGLDVRSVASKGIEENGRKRRRGIGSKVVKTSVKLLWYLKRAWCEKYYLPGYIYNDVYREDMDREQTKK
jgi:hypothetical protein